MIGSDAECQELLDKWKPGDRTHKKRSCWQEKRSDGYRMVFCGLWHYCI